jgi:hypothetical protein
MRLGIRRHSCNIDLVGRWRRPLLVDGSAERCVDRGGEHRARRRIRSLRAMYSRTSFNRSLVQLEGGLLRVPITVLQSEFELSRHIRDLFVSYSETLLAQIQQTVACNSLHSVQERICRWLLMMRDRAEGEVLTYTHEFLSEMLGVNRKSVTLAAQGMQHGADSRHAKFDLRSLSSHRSTRSGRIIAQSSR